ncbi:Rqc2 family fibronectin-binding protein [Desulfomonile tiedjei]|uniref:Putative RNA-binding protein, snRNP like protein n=1 Tax=Desulfomonile tiedjei (strain ATCC 49306 / DSM 6799 / DCB-1) TaxID=706587 RepID=I4C8A5_DESTA|nr:NFACT RNA binding domain-containing protein [Desulfomonile tiedjei]AFM25796.1 putative RNA-binding protein, snRNP like protein [Desulfomonile tiedjei DSM 6799]
MDLAVLQLVARELNDLLLGAFINKIHQPLPREVVLRMRAPGGGEQKLMVSADPQLGRIHLTHLKIPNPPRPPRFCAFLRAHFQGSKITGCSSLPDDRVVMIFATRGTGEERTERILVLELLGRDSNIILVDAVSGLILDCLHHIPEKEAGSRIVLPGIEYTVPPKHGRAAESLDEIVKERNLSPGIHIDSKGKKRLTVSAILPEDETFSAMNEAVDAFFRPRLESLLLNQAKREIAAPVRARINSLDRRLKKIKVDETRLKEFSGRQYEGELLKANLGKMRKGMDSIRVQDWITGGERIVLLEPSLNPVENMERIFRKAAKGKRGEQAVQRRVAETIAEMRALEDQLFYIMECDEIDELEMLAGDFHKETPQSKSQSRPPTDRESKLFRTFASPSGASVFVGLHARSNEFLVRKKARPGDLWFHVKDYPGAHVLLKKEGAAPHRAEDLDFAAALAVHFSKAANKGKVEVMIADAKDVSPMKGGIPGQVSVKHYRTIVSEGFKGGLPG